MISAEAINVTIDRGAHTVLVVDDNPATRYSTGRLIDEFFLPYLAIRAKGEGYAVSIVKAGATIVGKSAGRVRPPLSDLKPQEAEELAALIRKLGPQ
ncbi:hypothetical protein GCM10028794_28790 [Silanimonas algicola]